MSNVQGTQAKKVLPIIYAIDTSGSMDGDRNAHVNQAMRECENVLKEKMLEKPDAEIKLGVIKFASGAQWVTKSGLISLEDFYWNDVTAGGVTDLGAAINEIESKLSRTAFLVSETGFYLPVIIFMSDGGPNDDWQKALKNANDNNIWFKNARKIAIAIGDGADRDVLKELVGNIEAVIKSNDLETLKQLIVAVSVSAGMLAAQSRPVNDKVSGSDILNNAEKIINGDAEVERVTAAPVVNPDIDKDANADADVNWNVDAWNDN